MTTKPQIDTEWLAELADVDTPTLVQWLVNARDLIEEAERDAATVERKAVAERRVRSHQTAADHYSAELMRRAEAQGLVDAL